MPGQQRLLATEYFILRVCGHSYAITRKKHTKFYLVSLTFLNVIRRAKFLFFFILFSVIRVFMAITISLETALCPYGYKKLTKNYPQLLISQKKTHTRKQDQFKLRASRFISQFLLQTTRTR